jgi:hypothetical protein
MEVMPIAIHIQRIVNNLPPGTELMLDPSRFRHKRTNTTGITIHLQRNREPQFWLGCGNVHDAFVRVHKTWLGGFKAPIKICIQCHNGVHR